jgi:hypothetical protein
MNEQSTAYTFARIVNQKYQLGSERRALALFWLSSMPKEVIEAWGTGRLTDADIFKRADEMGLMSTTPWLKENEQ